MRRFLVVLLICFGAVLLGAGVAGAQVPYPIEPGKHNTNVAGTQVSSSSSTRLAFTGSQGTSALVWVGASLFVIGGGFVLISYRRRSLAP